jgi:predicted unusual protein kinase regulating ubiquinone biosynthesis (AarF/ABC1/UbiB family)
MAGEIIQPSVQTHQVFAPKPFVKTDNRNILDDIGNDSFSRSPSPPPKYVESSESLPKYTETAAPKQMKSERKLVRYLTSPIATLKERALQARTKNPPALPESNSEIKPLAKKFAEICQEEKSVTDTMETLKEEYGIIAKETLEHNPELKADLKRAGQTQEPLIQKTLLSEKFLEADTLEKKALLLSHSGVGAGKLFQILATDESLPLETRRIFSETKSNCAPTRTLEEAQEEVHQLYRDEKGQGKYTLTKRAGVATMGEVYFAKDQSGKPVVIKMLKKGITEESLQNEHRIAQDLVRELFSDPRKQEYELTKIKNLYSQFSGELNFEEEASNAKALAEGGTRYKVAQAIETATAPSAKYPTSMVQEVAKGLSLEEVSRMLEVYKQDPAQYHREFTSKFKSNPWLEKPEEWMHEVPALYRDTFNEQTLLNVKKGNVNVSHGDPHEGNVFIHVNPETSKLEMTYIDAGLVAKRSSARAVEHMAFSVNMLVGNTNAIARMMVNSAPVLPKGSDKEKLIKEVSTTLRKELFNGKVDITNGKYNSALMDKLMEKHGIFVPESETVFLKSNMQAHAVYRKWSALVGQPQNNYIPDSLSDIRKGASKLVKLEPTKTSHEAISTVGHVLSNPKQALTSVLQFTLPKLEHVIK